MTCVVGADLRLRTSERGRWARALQRRLHKRIGDQKSLLISCPLVQIQRVCFSLKLFHDLRRRGGPAPADKRAGAVGKSAPTTASQENRRSEVAPNLLPSCSNSAGLFLSKAVS